MSDQCGHPLPGKSCKLELQLPLQGLQGKEELPESKTEWWHCSSFLGETEAMMAAGSKPKQWILGSPQSVWSFPDKQMNGNTGILLCPLQGPTFTHSIKQPGSVLRAEWPPLLPNCLHCFLPGALNQVQRCSHVVAWTALCEKGQSWHHWVTISYFPCG